MGGRTEEQDKAAMRIFKQVPYVIFGKGEFARLNKLFDLSGEKNLSVLYLVDSVHKSTGLINRVKTQAADYIIPVDTSGEPTVGQVDELVEKIKNRELPTVIVGIGGGSVLDITKAVSVMLKNSGSSAEYQGWDLVKNPGVFKIGVPTLSGTGAEISRSAVLTGPEKKMGINSDFSLFDAILLDPELTKTAPKDQRFFTGMDCFIHSVEALSGRFLNAVGKGYATKTIELCEKYFLSEPDDADLMVASYFGGCSVANSEVGVCHALSYGLSLVLGIRHGLANCVVFNQLDEYYPEGIKVFRTMLEKNRISLPQHVTPDLREAEVSRMIRMALSMERPLNNALGEGWPTVFTDRKIKELYSRM